MVGATGFELVAHPREKLSGTTTVLQAKNSAIPEAFHLIIN